MFPFQSERNPSCEGDKKGEGGGVSSSGEGDAKKEGEQAARLGGKLREIHAQRHHTSLNIVRTDDMIDTRSLCTWNRILTLSKGATTVFAVAPAMPERAATTFLFSLWLADISKPTVAQSIAGDALRGAVGS